jgi:dolichyl-phosphate beta-glucosyltransferase
MLASIAKNGKVPVITAEDRAAARADLGYWRAGVLVVSGTEPHAAALVDAVTALVGRPGTRDAAGGVWLWDVRDISDSVR